MDNVNSFIKATHAAGPDQHQNKASLFKGGELECVWTMLKIQRLLPS